MSDHIRAGLLADSLRARDVVIRQWLSQVAVALLTAALAALIGVVVDALVAVVRRGGSGAATPAR